MERCEGTGDEGSVGKCCLSAATACLCVQFESHYNTEALVCALGHGVDGVYSLVCVSVCCVVLCVCVCVCVCGSHT